jgi:hypothetical protein
VLIVDDRTLAITVGARQESSLVQAEVRSWARE